MCVCVWSVAWQPKFQRPISLSTSSLGDYKVARVGRPATDYKIVVRSWESGIPPCIMPLSHGLTTAVCVCVCVCVCVPVCV